MIKRIVRWWERRHDNLRQACVDKYGEEFGELYDKLGSGEAIGNYGETIIFLNMIESVKKENKL